LKGTGEFEKMKKMFHFEMDENKKFENSLYEQQKFYTDIAAKKEKQLNELKLLKDEITEKIVNSPFSIKYQNILSNLRILSSKKPPFATAKFDKKTFMTYFPNDGIEFFNFLKKHNYILGERRFIFNSGMYLTELEKYLIEDSNFELTEYLKSFDYEYDDLTRLLNFENS
jgi:hypothetical protein